MQRLKDKNIYYIVTGAPSAEFAVSIVTEIVAEGASVFTIPTKSSEAFVDIKRLKKIKNNTVKNDWSCDIKLPLEDAVLIAPCTFNTLNAIVSARADSYPLCLIASSIGKKIPVFIALAMNKSLWNHPTVQENIKKLESWGCQIIWPEITLDVVTMVDIGKILDTLYFSFKRVNYIDKKVYRKELLKKLSNYRRKYFKEFSRVGVFLKENNLNLHSAGCMSLRVEDGFLITSSGSDLSELKEKNISLVSAWDENKNLIEWCGDNIPSSETPLHCVIQDEEKDKMVLHIHCPKMTYSHVLIKYNSASYMRYGTFEIGHKAKAMLRKDKFFIMKYHGEVVAGNNCNDLENTVLKYFKKI